MFNRLINQKNKGFVILLAVTLASIILAIALGVSNIALKEVSFSTSAKNSNEAFFASDVGAECALYNDKSVLNKFPIAGPATTISCAGSSITPTFTANSATRGTYDFIITGIGSSSAGCAIVQIIKDNSLPPIATNITSKGYNIGNSSCASSSTSRIERELDVSY